MATKQTLFAGLASVLLITSCSQEEILNNEPGAPRRTIGFNVTADRASRAASIYDSKNVPTEFYLGAWYHTGDAASGKEYIHEDKIKKNLSGDYENVTDLRYWPTAANEQLSFFAYEGGTLPAGASFSLTDPDGHFNPNISGFKIQTDAASQADLVFAKAHNLASTTNKVSLQFSHALAQVRFAAKTDSRHIHVEISEVALGGMSTVGDFYFGATTSDTPEWKAATGDIKTELTSAMGTRDVSSQEFTAGTVVLTDKEEGKDATAVDLTPDYQQAFMVLPYKYTAAEKSSFNAITSTGSYIRVTCKIYNIANPQTGYASTDVKIHDGELYIPCDFDWTAGSKYTYTISFGTGTAGLKADGSETLTKVSIETPTVDDWTDEPGTDLTE